MARPLRVAGRKRRQAAEEAFGEDGVDAVVHPVDVRGEGNPGGVERGLVAGLDGGVVVLDRGPVLLELVRLELAPVTGEPRVARALLLATTRRTLVFTLPLALGLPAALAVLPVLGEGYEGALGIFPVVALGIAFWGVQTLWQQVLLAAGRASLPLYVSVAGAVLNLGLNVLLVPRFAEMGAAVATLVSFAAMAALAALLARPYLRVREAASA